MINIYQLHRLFSRRVKPIVSILYFFSIWHFLFLVFATDVFQSKATEEFLFGNFVTFGAQLFSLFVAIVAFYAILFDKAWLTFFFVFAQFSLLWSKFDRLFLPSIRKENEETLLTLESRLNNLDSDLITIAESAFRIFILCIPLFIQIIFIGISGWYICEFYCSEALHRFKLNRSDKRGIHFLLSDETDFFEDIGDDRKYGSIKPMDVEKFEDSPYRFYFHVDTV